MRPEARSRARRARREHARVRVGARGGGGGVGPLGRGSRDASRNRGEGRRGDALANRGVRAQLAHARGTRRAKGSHARWTARGGTRRRLGLVRVGRVDASSRGDEPRRVIRGGDEGRRVVSGWDAALLARVAGYFRERPGSTFAKPPTRELVAALDDAAREFVAGCRGDDERDAGGDEDAPGGHSSRPNASASLTVFEEYAKLRAVDGNPFEISSETTRTLLDAAVANLPDATYAQLEAFCAAIRRADDEDAGREKRAFASRARDATEARMLETVASNPPWKRPRAPGSALRLAFAWRDAFGVDATASMRDDLRLAMAEELAVKSRHMDPRTVVETLGVAADMGSNAPMTGATFAALKSSLARAGRDRGPHSPATLRAALDALARLTHPKNAALGRGDKVLTRRLASRLCGDVEETWDSICSSSRASSDPGFEFADAVADLRRLAACANWGRPDGWFWTESVPAAAAIARAAETTTESATIEDAIDALGVLGNLRASFRNVAEGDGARETPETRAREIQTEPEHRVRTRTQARPRNSPTEFPSEISRVADALLRRVESAAREGATPFGAADGRDVARVVAAAAAFARDDATRATLPRIQGLLAVAETLARETRRSRSYSDDEVGSYSDDEVGSYSDDEVGSYSDGSRSRPAAPRGMSKRDALGVTLRARSSSSPTPTPPPFPKTFPPRRSFPRVF